MCQNLTWIQSGCSLTNRTWALGDALTRRRHTIAFPLFERRHDFVCCQMLNSDSQRQYISAIIVFLVIYFHLPSTVQCIFCWYTGKLKNAYLFFFGFTVCNEIKCCDGLTKFQTICNYLIKKIISIYLLGLDLTKSWYRKCKVNKQAPPIARFCQNLVFV